MSFDSSSSSSPSTLPALEVRLFSVLRERAGRSTLTIDLDGPLTGEELLDRLEAELPSLRAYRSVLRLAVNLEYVDLSATIRPGDEVAIITPVSGG